MAIIDNIKDAVTRFIPQKRESLPEPGSAGHGMHRGEDLILSKTFIVASSFQIFLSFIAMCCFAGVASFQAKHKVGPSFLSILAIFDSLVLFFLAAFLLAVPVIYDRYDRLAGLFRALRVTRVALICNGIGIFFSLITAFVTTISVFTQPGCKDPKKDPSAKSAGKAFVAGLPDWCQTKRAGAIFFWLTLLAWLVTTYLAFQEWRTGKTVYRPEDPPFKLPPQPVQPHDEDDTDPYSAPPRRQRTEEEDELHDSRSPFGDNRYAGYNSPAGRPSMDAYGAFSDPNPSGYGHSQYDQPAVSRTMQYADPYAAVRQSIHGGASSPAPGIPQAAPYSGGYQR
ncbi:SubName: Full=Uncharacterized protein {ECO:0000313/EMBL:CCA71321.1} [Serendipita indica DSM 11827]|uniref:MARVEL domain-containing protein n=1 Tax=Serendipita indica (strain DSM 11827) TaxID=1109443 RepID=G4TJ34_SERID|nr:SubName: Full=Uncharacterized protein {ECO:0000313/EMBL:CCA71321.1} [Serendipita indica DSM 11827]CCA71321.1 hypothetical protein PIIN_05260 [Serendipita indica DSM 11827]